MANRWLKLLEAHVEKAIVGLAALYMFAMLFFYLVRSPNTVEYQGRKLTPGELLEVVKQDADRLAQTFRGGAPEVAQVESFSAKLKQLHSGGIFAASSGAAELLKPELPLASVWGPKIEMPGKEAEEPPASVALRQPLAPSKPAVRTGRSLVLRRSLRLAGPGEIEPAETELAEEAAKPVETAWVTVAAYFDRKAQYQEMIKAGYAPFRAKAYVVGLDVQRQEMLSTGEFSEWQDVKPSAAMPKIELVEPQFDDQTGELINKEELRNTFDLIKQYQPLLMQPPFYAVEDGDFWEVPPLAGYEDLEAEEEELAEQERPAPSIGEGGRTRIVLAPSAPPRGPRGGRSPGGRGGEAGPVGRGPVVPARGESRDRKAEVRKQIREQLNDARRLLGSKDYRQALDLANRVLNHPEASAGDRTKAKRISKIAERWLKREERQTRLAGGGVPGVALTAGRTAPRGGEREAFELVRHPETSAPAVWFHDDSVEPGKTYRYRARVKLWNRYVGRPRPLKNPEGAKRAVIAGEWSEPSEPITVTPSTYFFVTGSRPPESAGIEVFKWRQGFWISERFDVGVGEVIGGVRTVEIPEWDEEGRQVRAPVDFTTGAVVLDLRFDEPVAERWRGQNGVFSYRERTSTVMVYLDPADGQVRERVMIFDRRDPTYRELKEQEF